MWSAVQQVEPEWGAGGGIFNSLVCASNKRRTVSRKINKGVAAGTFWGEGQARSRWEKTVPCGTVSFWTRLAQ